jgi:hypothetical protein
MPATVLAERGSRQGSSSWFRENVARLRPEQRRCDPADLLVWAPGDAAQCDLWFPPKKIPLRLDPPVPLNRFQIRHEPVERILTGRLADTRLAGPVEIRPDSVPASVEMTRDRRNRPSLCA